LTPCWCRFVLSNPLVGSTVVGATSSQQLEEILDAADKGPLSLDLLAAVEDIHQRFPNPNP
jgi:aryl-alcohol dehydrogenase-like predicted oxidoreductase